MKLLIATENDDEVIEQPTVSKDMVDIEKNDVEIKEQADDVVDTNDNVESAIQDSETLGKIKEIIEKQVDGGEAISETTAKIASVAIESIFERLNVKSKPIPSMEAFSSKHSKLKASQIAVETIGKTIDAIWEAVKNAIKAVRDKIVEFFKTFFTQTGRIKFVANNLKKKLSKVENEPKEKYMEYESISRAFLNGANGKVEMDVVLANHMLLTKNFLNTSDTIKEAAHAFGVQLSNPTELKEGVSKQLVNVSTKLIHGFDSKSNITDDETKIGPFVDCTYLSVTNGSSSGLETFNVGFARYKAIKEVKQITVLNKTQANTVCNAVIKLMEITEEYKNKESKIVGALNEFINLVDSIINLVNASRNVNKEDNGKILDSSNIDIHYIKRGISKLNSAMNLMAFVLPSYNSRACEFALTYVMESLKQLEPLGEEKTVLANKLLTA